MTRPHLIARLMLAALGVNMLNHSLGQIISAIFPVSTNYSPETFVARTSIITAESVITLAASMILLFWSDGLTRLIAGSEAEQCETTDACSIIAGFRLTMCLCGILIIYQPISLLIPAIINSPKMFFDAAINRSETPLPARTLVMFITQTIRGVLGVYLVFGAPHYVCWQMRTIAVKARGEK